MALCAGAEVPVLPTESVSYRFKHTPRRSFIIITICRRLVIYCSVFRWSVNYKWQELAMRTLAENLIMISNSITSSFNCANRSCSSDEFTLQSLLCLGRTTMVFIKLADKQYCSHWTMNLKELPFVEKNLVKKMKPDILLREWNYCTGNMTVAWPFNSRDRPDRPLFEDNNGNTYAV